MAITIKDNGKITREMAKVLKLMQMAMCMMANGKTAKCLDKAH
jgi:hypothetical protein